MMIKKIEVYLITDGNGAEAIPFYEDAFEAEVVSVTKWKDQVPDCPKEREELILNAQLDINGIRLMISDENPDFPYQAGQQMSAAIIVNSMANAKRLFEKLSQGAQAIPMPLQETFWSPAYAIVVDRFGMNWQINTELED